MAQRLLDDPQIASVRFQELGCERVAQQVRVEVDPDLETDLL